VESNNHQPSTSATAVSAELCTTRIYYKLINQLHTVLPHFASQRLAIGQPGRVRRLVRRSEKILKPEVFSSFSGKPTCGRVDIVAIAGDASFSSRKAAPMSTAVFAGLGQGRRLLGQQEEVEVAGGPFQTVEGLSHPFHAEAEP